MLDVSLLFFQLDCEIFDIPILKYVEVHIFCDLNIFIMLVDR